MCFPIELLVNLTSNMAANLLCRWDIRYSKVMNILAGLHTEIYARGGKL